MGVYKSTVSSKGQVVLPAEMRKSLGISTGSEVFFAVDGDRAYITTSLYDQIRAVRGSFAHVKPSLTAELRRERRKERIREHRER